MRHKKGTLIIDEIQKAPSLLLAIKQVVDADNRPGQFLLTGSAVSRNDAKHMVWFKDNIAREREFIGIVLYTGEITLPLG